MVNGMKKIIIKSICVIVLLILINLLIFVASNNPTSVESIYSQNIFVGIMSVFSVVSGIIPFSLTEFIIVTAVIIFLFTLYLLIRRFSVTNLINYILNIFIFISAGVFLFWGLWGINNYRVGLESSLDLNKSKYTVEELKEACYILAEKAGEARAKLTENNRGIATNDYTYKDIFSKVPTAYENIAKKYFIIPAGGYVSPKPMLFSELMSMLNYTGMYNPLFFELNINVNEPIYNMPATVCHEVAHQKGFTKENEANFISFLTCTNSEDEFFQYSGYLLGLIHCSNALYKQDSEAYYQLMGTYSEGVRRDLKYNNEYWSNYKGFVAKVGEANNNAFLKSTNQPEGTKSYGLVVDLIIAYLKNV